MPTTHCKIVAMFSMLKHVGSDNVRSCNDEHDAIDAMQCCLVHSD